MRLIKERVCNKIKIWLPDCFLCTSVCPRSSILLRGWESSGENPVYWLQQGGSPREPLQWGRSGHCGTAANTADQCGKTQTFGIGKAQILFVNTICDSIYAFYIKKEIEACHYCNLATLLLFLCFNTLTFVIHLGRLVSILLYLKQTLKKCPICIARSKTGHLVNAAADKLFDGLFITMNLSHTVKLLHHNAK